MHHFKLAQLLCVFLFFIGAKLCQGQSKSGYSISTEFLQWDNLLFWNDEPFGPGTLHITAESMNPATTLAIYFDRKQIIGKSYQSQFFKFGIVCFYHHSTYNELPLVHWYPQLFPTYLKRTDQVFVGIYLAYNKEFLTKKQKRTRYRPFVEARLNGSYGIYQKHTFNNSISHQPEHQEQVYANNFLILTGQLNIGANIYLGAKKHRSIGFYFPLGYTQTFSESFNSFPYWGFGGIKYSWF